MDEDEGTLDLNMLSSLGMETTLSKQFSLSSRTSELIRGVSERSSKYNTDILEGLNFDIDINVATSAAVLSREFTEGLEQNEEKWVMYVIMDISGILKEDNPQIAIDECVRNSMEFLTIADQMYSQVGMGKVLMNSIHQDSHTRIMLHNVISDYLHITENIEEPIQSPWIPGLSTNKESYAELYAWSETNQYVRINELHQQIQKLHPQMAPVYEELKYDPFIGYEISELRDLVKKGDVSEQIAEEFAKKLAERKVRNVKNRISVSDIDLDSLERSLKEMILTPV